EVDGAIGPERERGRRQHERQKRRSTITGETADPGGGARDARNRSIRGELPEIVGLRVDDRAVGQREDVVAADGILMEESDAWTCLLAHPIAAIEQSGCLVIAVACADRPSAEAVVRRGRHEEQDQVDALGEEYLAFAISPDLDA